MQGTAEQGMGLNYRRRVVYRALTQCFADEGRARRHFTLWNREFAAQAHVALARFVSAVAREDDLDSTARGRLQRALYEGLSLRYEQLAWVPDDWMPAANQTGEFPAVPAAQASADAAQPGVRASVAAASGAVDRPVDMAPDAPTAHAPTASIAQPGIERADRRLFRVLAAPLIAALCEDTDPHPGLLDIALADLANTLDADERPAHVRLVAWAGTRFLDRDLPVMAEIDGYRALLTLLRRMVADLDGDAVADRLLTEALVRAKALPDARLCSPLLLI